MPGMLLSQRDLVAMREIAQASTTANAGPTHGAGLPVPVLNALHRLVPCDELCVAGADWKVLGHYLDDSVHDQDSGIERSVCREPIPYDGVGPEHGFWGTFWSDACSYPERTGDYGCTRLSDFLTDRQLRAGRSYAENLRPRGFLHETMVVWPDGHGRTLRVLFFRGPGQDFNERDRFILELLRPHLIAAYNAPAQRQPNAGANLTDHQRAILQFVSEGYTNAQIARRMNLAEGTVRTHLNGSAARVGDSRG